MTGKRKNLVKWKKRGFFLLKGIILAAVLFITLFPICWLVKTSSSPTEDIQSGMVFPIKNVTFSHYRQLFVEKGFDTALKNSLINAVAALVLSLSFGLATAYILARKRFRFGMRRPIRRLRDIGCAGKRSVQRRSRWGITGRQTHWMRNFLAQLRRNML